MKFLKWFGIACLISFLLWAVTACTRTPKPSQAGSTAASAPANPGSTVNTSTPVPDIHVGDKPGILSGLGKVFSTPEGTARRQARKDAAATVPRKLGKGAVYAPAAKEVLYAWKPDAPVVSADTGSTVNVAVGKKAPVIAGDGNTVPTTNNNGFPWWMVAVGIALAGVVVYRKRLPFIGPFFS